MPTKYGIIQIQGPVDELWAKSRQYWASKRMKINNSQISENGLIRKLEFKSTANMHFYAYSFGEKYSFQFIYQPQSRVTTIIISSKYSVLGGRGFIWKIPQETIDKWVKYMGFPHIELKNEPSPDFLAAKDYMAQNQSSSENPRSSSYCPHCGVIIP